MKTIIKNELIIFIIAIKTDEAMTWDLLDIIDTIFVKSISNNLLYLCLIDKLNIFLTK